MDRKGIIKSKNPHWCVSYLKDKRDDIEVDDLVKIILGSKSSTALFGLSRLRNIDPRLKHLTRGEFLKRLRQIGVNGRSLNTV